MEKPEFYSAIEIYPSVSDPKRLVFVAAEGAQKLPREMLYLRKEYEQVARVVSVLFEDSVETRINLFRILHRAADRGFRGNIYDVEDGRHNLKEVMSDVVDCSYAVRAQKLAGYTSLLIKYGAVPIVAGCGVLERISFNPVRSRMI